MDYRMTLYNTIIEKYNQYKQMPDGIDKELLLFEINDLSDTYRHMCYDFRDVVAEEALPYED